MLCTQHSVRFNSNRQIVCVFFVHLFVCVVVCRHLFVNNFSIRLDFLKKEKKINAPVTILINVHFARRYFFSIFALKKKSSVSANSAKALNYLAEWKHIDSGGYIAFNTIITTQWMVEGECEWVVRLHSYTNVTRTDSFEMEMSDYLLISHFFA